MDQDPIVNDREQSLGDYLRSVASWGRVRPEEASKASFIGNALGAGHGSYQAVIGWVLTGRNASNAARPHKLRRPAPRVTHHGRTTESARTLRQRQARVESRRQAPR